jgi:DNA processing protein
MTTTAATLIEAAAPFEGERAARAIWSAIAEPNDPVIGRTITAHGAAGALAVVIDGEASDVEGIDELRQRITPRANAGHVARSIQTAARIGAHLITPESAEWPTQLNDLGATSPVALWLRGNPELLTSAQITTVVGARAATGYGEHIALEFTSGLVARDHTIASGGAYGIDGMAHRAALAADGKTIAALAGGIDRFYPMGHESLLARIAETGAVVSEVACGSAPTRYRFLARNRILASLAARTVVIEAGIRSGSIHTASQALAIGRAVGAVPGSLTSPASAGCHRLIRECGAHLVTSVDDIAAL